MEFKCSVQFPTRSDCHPVFLAIATKIASKWLSRRASERQAVT